jgi:hypothetical protein
MKSSFPDHFHLTINIVDCEELLMAKFDGIKGQELLDVEEQKDELTLIFKDNRFLFIKIENGKLVSDSVPE